MTTEEINKARGCACLTTLQEYLDKEVGQEVEMQLRTMMLMNPKADNWEMYSELPPLIYKWRENRKVRSSHVKFAFCPFCGVKKP